MEVDERRVFGGGYFPDDLDIPPMQRNQVLEVGQPAFGQGGRFLPGLVGSRGREQYGDDVVFTGNANHLAEIVAEVIQRNPYLAGFSEELLVGEECSIDELNGSKAGKSADCREELSE